MLGRDGVGAEQPFHPLPPYSRRVWPDVHSPPTPLPLSTCPALQGLPVLQLRVGTTLVNINKIIKFLTSIYGCLERAHHWTLHIIQSTPIERRCRRGVATEVLPQRCWRKEVRPQRRGHTWPQKCCRNRRTQRCYRTQRQGSRSNIRSAEPAIRPL